MRTYITLSLAVFCAVLIWDLFYSYYRPWQAFQLYAARKRAKYVRYGAFLRHRNRKSIVYLVMLVHAAMALLWLNR